MHKTVVIVGDSPLSVLIGRLIDRDLARQTHIEAVHLTRDPSFVYAPRISSLLGKQSFTLKNRLYRHVSCQTTTVRQIDLIDRRVITTDGIVDYDALILDLTPTYTAEEIKKIAAQATRLINEVQAKAKSGQQLKARITFAGADAVSWQIALALAADLSVMSTAVQRALSVQAQFPPIAKLREFLVENGVTSRKSVALLPGLTIGAPKAPLKNRSVRGALLDDRDNFILRETLNPEGHPETIVIDGDWRLAPNILKVEQTLASRLVGNVERFLEGERQRPIHCPRPSGILKAQDGEFVWFGSLQSSGWRAKIIAWLDRGFYEKLVG